MPLQARVTLESVHFDGRAVGGAPEGCARCLMCRCEPHILNPKSSRDAFAAQRHEGHFCGCVMYGRATQGSCIAQDGAFGGRAVGGAPGAIFIYGAPLIRTPYDCDKIPGRVFGRDQITCAEIFCGCVSMGRPLRAHVLIEILRILMGERSVAHPELRALFDVPL